MGFINFLGRRQAPIQDDVSTFKAQEYASTAESLPPVLGTNPIPGNGVNAIGSNGIHQLPRPRKSRPQLPTSTSAANLRAGSASPATSFSSAAPAPLVPRLRGYSNASRPNTAPGEPGAITDAAFQSRPKSSGKTRSRRDSLRHTVAFLRKSESQTELSRPNSTYAPPVPPIPATHTPVDAASTTYARSDAASISLSTTLSLSGSLNRGPGHVDILDAQGELRPGNFRSRVQAAGARDYGEDVAERNIGMNGVNLGSPAVAAYYATSSQRPTNGSQSHLLDPLAQRPRTVNYPRRVDSLDQTAPQHKSTEPKSGRSAKKEVGDFWYHDKHGGRRKSGVSSSKHRPQRLPLQADVSNASGSAAEPPEVPRVRANKRNSRQFDDNPLPSSQNASDSTLVATHRSKRPSDGQGSLSLEIPSRPRPRDSATHRRERASKHRSLIYDEVGSGLGNLAVESTADYDFATAAPAPSIPSFSRSKAQPEASLSRHDSSRSRSAHGPRRSARPRSLTRPSSSTSAPGYTYPRTRSLGGVSLPGRPILGDITEHIPPRVSSRRNWSISSSTPPVSASDWSSDPYHRPRSGHTARTSIPASGSVKSLSLGTLKDVLYKSRAQAYPDQSTRDESANEQNLSVQAEQAHSGLVKGKGLDEPMQKQWSPHDDDFGQNPSDSDCSDQSRDMDREENLLFREDGYGQSGAGLPGLFDGRQSPTPSDWSLHANDYEQAFDLTTPGGLRPPTTPSATRTVTGSDALKLPSFDTSSNDGGSDVTSDSELDAKLDAKMAMRVRRELKRRTRVANIERRHGKQPMYADAAMATTAAAPTSYPQRA